MTRCRLPNYLGIKLVICVCCLILASVTFSQKNKADSIRNLLSTEKKDTNRVRLLWQLAGAVDIYDPDEALQLSQEALYLSRELKYVEGQSKALGALANTFVKMGNYPRAVAFYLEKLKLEEKRNTPRNLASVLMNLGVVNVLQEEYQKALEYYALSDSVIRQYDIEDMKYFILLNLGDVNNRMNRSDTAFSYFSKSLLLAEKMNDNDLIGTAMTGLGHSYLKMGNYPLSQYNYQKAIDNLRIANDDDILCEATLGIANLYEQMKKPDSAKYYASVSLNVANRGGFLSHQLEAAKFLAKHYNENKNIDSAYVYMTQVLRFNDSVNSKTKIRESQILSTNEQLRQQEIQENKKLAAKERFKQLQLLLIAMFIPGFFLFTISLSRFRINIRFIKILGILSLLILFEFLTLLLHPIVAEITHHKPVLELSVFVAIAAILIPTHHRIEHWLVEKLVRDRAAQQSLYSRLKRKVSTKQPPAAVVSATTKETETGGKQH